MSTLRTLLFRSRRKFYRIFPSQFSAYQIHAEVAGEKFPFHIGTFEASHWYGKHKDHLTCDIETELAFTKKHIAPGEILADIGAHHGYYSLFFSKCVGKSGKVYAFECLPTNFNLLKRNLLLNQALNIFPEPYAVGNQEGEIAIANDSSGILLSPKEKCTVRAPLLTLDTFFAKEKILPTMLKIDVEGYEWEVLQGSQLILATRPKVVLEIHNFAHADPRPRLEGIFDCFKGYRTIFWQKTQQSEIEAFKFSSSALSALLQKPNPRLFLIP